MKTKHLAKTIIMACTFFILAAANINGQTYDYTVDWTDTSTYDITCGTVVPAKWSVKNDSCEMTTPFFWVAAAEGTDVIYSIRINQSGNGESTDRCYVFHQIDLEDWVLDSMFVAGGDPAVFSVDNQVFLDYSHYIRFKICLKTDAGTEFWAIMGGDISVTDGVESEQKIIVYTSRPPIPSSPLPIELISFEGQALDNMVELSWVTASETNNDFFTIERSADCGFFEVIGFVDGAGNSNINNEYMFYDTHPYDISYYRLKQTDFNGLSTHSQVINVQAPTETATNIQITSSGQELHFLVNAKERGIMKINIYNIFGQLQECKLIEVEKSQNSFIIKPRTEVNSLYIVSASIENNTPCISKVYLD